MQPPVCTRCCHARGGRPALEVRAPINAQRSHCQHLAHHGVGGGGTPSGLLPFNINNPPRSLPGCPPQNLWCCKGCAPAGGTHGGHPPEGELWNYHTFTRAPGAPRLQPRDEAAASCVGGRHIVCWSILTLARGLTPRATMPHFWAVQLNFASMVLLYMTPTMPSHHR